MEYPPGLCSLPFSLLTDLGLMVVIQGEIVQSILLAINTRLRFWKESSREVCILALLALLIWLSFGEKWVFWLFLKKRACFWYGLGTMCFPLQSPTVFSSSILMVGKEQHTQDAHVSSALCLQQQSHGGANLPSCHQEGASTLQEVTVFTSSLLTSYKILLL